MKDNKLQSAYYFVAVLILAVAFTFRVYWSPGGEVYLEESLSNIPVELGGLRGVEQSLQEKVLDVLGLTDYVYRDYIPKASDSKLPINLYIGYYASQSKGKTYHSPKNCLPGSGWEFTEVSNLPIVFDNVKYRINKVLIQKGLERQLVLYWFQDRGRVIENEYWAKIYLVLDSIFKRRTDGSFVRIIVPIRGSVDDAVEEAAIFAGTLYPHLKKILPD